MNNPYIILIAGASATGKTTFAKYASSSLYIPLVCKDEIKQILWNKEQYEKDYYLHCNKLNGTIAYKILFYFTEQLMKTQKPFILESNFRKQAEDTFKELIKRYKYKVMTILFNADIEILHKRFLLRDQLAERHPGLKSEGFYSDINIFQNAIAEDCKFSIGSTLEINTNDFNTVDYNDIIEKINVFANRNSISVNEE